MIDQAHVQWCKNLFRTLADGGAWGVPRSGMLFKKQGAELVLTARMPHVIEMPITAAQLAEQQDSEFDTIREHFAAAGIPVRNGIAP